MKIITSKDQAKYPFLKSTVEKINRLGLSISDLTKKEYTPIVDRALCRLKNAVVNFNLGPWQNAQTELLSFPVAVLLAASTEDSFVKKRYALTEAKRVYSYLQNETTQKVLAVAENLLTSDQLRYVPPHFKLRFDVYLRNTAFLKGKKWTLVNRRVQNGFVVITKEELSRILSEVFYQHILSKIEKAASIKLPSTLSQHVVPIIKAAEQFVSRKRAELPETIREDAFPPCIIFLQKALARGDQLSHIERFTLASFLLCVGASVDHVVKMFTSATDFDIMLTRYQVEHIAGLAGSKVKYEPPRCANLKIQGVCRNPDKLCSRIRTPLQYYKEKIRQNKNKKIIN